MKLKNIHIQNFRGFKDFQVEFAQNTTVFIGKNGTGKTSLISAVKKGLSFMFAKSKKYKKSLSESNNCTVRSFSLWDSRFDEIERAFTFPIANYFEAYLDEKEIKWTSYKKQDPGSLHPTLYKDALNSILQGYNNSKDYNLPLISFFSDSYPHIQSNLGQNASRIARMDVLPRDFGYYAWDENSNCAELWQSRYIKISNYLRDLEDDIEKTEESIDFMDIQIRNKDEYDEHKIPEWEKRKNQLIEKLSRLKADNFEIDFRREKDFIDEKIRFFTKPLREDLQFLNSEFQIDRISVNRPDKKSFSLEFSFNSGKTMHFEILPAGYKRLLSIVFDVAYRSYILNGDKVTSGIVIIDEIELHLHPILQQEVLERFRTTFPNIQFIISTHSPLVVSNLKESDQYGHNRVIKLFEEDGDFKRQNIDNVYGVDYITSLVEVMDSSQRPSSVDKLIDMYASLKIRHKDEAASLVFEKLKEIFNGEPNEFVIEEIDRKIKSAI